MDLSLHKNNCKYIDIKVEMAWKHNFSDILLMIWVFVASFYL